MADHEHGKMNIDVQEQTFENFVKYCSYAVVLIVFALIMLAFINV